MTATSPFAEASIAEIRNHVPILPVRNGKNPVATTTEIVVIDVATNMAEAVMTDEAAMIGAEVADTVAAVIGVVEVVSDVVETIGAAAALVVVAMTDVVAETLAGRAVTDVVVADTAMEVMTGVVAETLAGRAVTDDPEVADTAVAAVIDGTVVEVSAVVETIGVVTAGLAGVVTIDGAAADLTEADVTIIAAEIAVMVMIDVAVVSIEAMMESDGAVDSAEAGMAAVAEGMTVEEEAIAGAVLVEVAGVIAGVDSVGVVMTVVETIVPDGENRDLAIEGIHRLAENPATVPIGIHPMDRITPESKRRILSYDNQHDLRPLP